MSNQFNWWRRRAVIALGIAAFGLGPILLISLMPRSGSNYSNWVSTPAIMFKRSVKEPIPTQALNAQTSALTPQSTPELSRQPNLNKVSRVLMYHYIRAGVDPQKDKLGYNLSISPGQFEQELQWIKRQGLTVVTMSELVQRQPSHAVALTFDDGYADFYQSAFPLLQKYGFKATVYVISGKVGGNYLSIDQINALSQAGIEIGAHSVSHRNLKTLPKDQQYQEIWGSKQALESLTGHTVESFCYPSGQYSSLTAQLVQKAGFTSATTTQSGVYQLGSDPYLIHRLRVSPDLSASRFQALLP